MQASEVTSPVPISSFSARRTTSRISGCISIETILYLLQLGFVFGQLRPDAVYDLRRRLTQKDVIRELALRIGDVFRELVAVLFQALLLRFELTVGDVDHHIEVRAGADGATLRDFADAQRDAGELLHGAEVDFARHAAF